MKMKHEIIQDSILKEYEIESEIEYILKNVYDDIFEPKPKSISEVRLEKLNKIFGKKLK